MRFLYFIVSSSVLILLVWGIRTFLKRQLSPAVLYALWLIPAIRLMTPFVYLELPFTAPYEWFQQGVSYVAEGGWRFMDGPEMTEVSERQTVSADAAEAPALTDTAPEASYGPQNAVPVNEAVPAAAVEKQKGKESGGLSRAERMGLLLWLCGSMVVGGYALVSNRRLGRTVRHMDMSCKDSPLPVCLSNAVVAPCLFGLFKPRILLNWKVKENPELYQQVLRHELTHYRQKDHIWTFVRILLCVIYWWNPFVWLGAVCSREDAELSCDWRVTRRMDAREKKEYGLALLLLLQQTRNRPAILYSATSMNGQGRSLKRRIESITKDTRTRKWVLFPVCLALVACLTVGCSMPSGKSWIHASWKDADSSPETLMGAEYEYDLKEEIASRLFYYEIYTYGTLTERHVLAYGGLGEERTGIQAWALERTEEENDCYVVWEEQGAKSREKLLLPADVDIRNGGACVLEPSEKHQVHAGDDLLLAVKFFGKASAYEEEPKEGDPVYSYESLAGKSEEELSELLSDNYQTILIHLVLSDLPEQELAARYEPLAYPAAGENAGEKAGGDAWTESETLAHTWAEAFCGKDGEMILGLASEEVRGQMQEEMLMDVLEDGTVIFGWSSPWPGMFTEEGYKILFVDEYGAEILYYAGVSDPHLIVWREQLAFAREDGRLVIDSSKLRILDRISTAEEFFLAYPGMEITGTPMDYAANGLGEYLNDHAMNETDMEVYQLLKDPALAVCSLLNLERPWTDMDGEPQKVDISLTETDQRVIAQILFEEDQSVVEVQMVQPYGEDGIWIPETAYFPWSGIEEKEAQATVSAASGEVSEESGEKLSTATAVTTVSREDDWQPAELTYVAPDWLSTPPSDIFPEEEREENAQRALKELYDLTGYRVEACVYTYTDTGSYSFAKSADDMEHSRVFYSRCFGQEDNEQLITTMYLANARRVWYSDVQQLLVPENVDQMTNGELAVWFLQRSGLYQGEEIRETGPVFDTEPELVRVTMKDGTFYEVQLDREIQSVSDMCGPYPEGFEH